MQLLSPLPVGDRTAPSRVMFGPHVTNLGADDRSLTHVGTPRTTSGAPEAAPASWSSKVPRSTRATGRTSALPSQRSARSGWSAIAAAVQSHGALAIASLDHSGGQGSSAFSQSPLWAPSRVPEVNAREVPKWMEADDIDAVIAGFVLAAARACAAGWMGSRSMQASTVSFASSCPHEPTIADDEWGDGQSSVCAPSNRSCAGRRPQQRVCSRTPPFLR